MKNCHLFVQLFLIPFNTCKLTNVSQSLYRAKNSNDQRDQFKVKYFLLDKNSPYFKAGVDSVGNAASTETAATATAAAVLTDSDAAATAAAEVEPADPPLGNISTANNYSNSSSEANSNGNDNGNSNNNSTSAAGPVTATATAVGLATKPLPPAPLTRAYSTERAAGELVGIIHSATINHLSIRIQTESGEYLNLTVRETTNLISTAHWCSPLTFVFHIFNRLIQAAMQFNARKIGSL